MYIDRYGLFPLPVVCCSGSTPYNNMSNNSTIRAARVYNESRHPNARWVVKHNQIDFQIDITRVLH
jgi:hypothetical protein